MKGLKGARIQTEQLFNRGNLVLGTPGSTIINSEVTYLANIARTKGAFGVIIGGSAQHDYTPKLESNGAPTIGFNATFGGLPDLDVAFIAAPEIVSEIGKQYKTLMPRADHAPLILDTYGNIHSMFFANQLTADSSGAYVMLDDHRINVDVLPMNTKYIWNAVEGNVHQGNLVIIPIW